MTGTHTHSTICDGVSETCWEYLCFCLCLCEEEQGISVIIICFPAIPWHANHWCQHLVDGTLIQGLVLASQCFKLSLCLRWLVWSDTYCERYLMLVKNGLLQNCRYISNVWFYIWRHLGLGDTETLKVFVLFWILSGWLG